jgi:hypothetical protein
MKDFLGQELTIGDRVIVPEPGIAAIYYNYVGFSWGTIIKFTPKMVRVSYGAPQCGERLLDTRAVLKMTIEQEHALTMKILKA